MEHRVEYSRCCWKFELLHASEIVHFIEKVSALLLKMNRRFEETLTCPICLELFRTPLQMPCGHTICRECLGEIRAASSTENRYIRKVCYNSGVRYFRFAEQINQSVQSASFASCP